MTIQLPENLNKYNLLSYLAQVSAIEKQTHQELIIIDCAKVKSIDSMGLALLVRLHFKSQTKLINLTEAITQLARLYSCDLS